MLGSGLHRLSEVPVRVHQFSGQQRQWLPPGFSGNTAWFRRRVGDLAMVIGRVSSRVIAVLALAGTSPPRRPGVVTAGTLRDPTRRPSSC